MNARILQDIDHYRSITPLFKWLRGDALSSDHWLELFRIIKLWMDKSILNLYCLSY